MQEISIELQIANRKYPLKVKETEAASVRKAAELVNLRLTEFEKRYGVKDIQDLFAMSALQITTQLVDLESGKTENTAKVEQKLDELIYLLDSEISIAKV